MNQLENRLDDIFLSPLSKKYCVYFYFFSVIGLIGLVVCLLDAVISMVGYHSRGLLPYCISFAFIYFQNRLLYSMCVA